jgi:DNA-binding beta-propeller fold protein YncE
MASAVLASLLMLTDTASAQSVNKEPLQFEAKILLGDVHGRIDHMAVDIKRRRLFVAALGDGSLAQVDLKTHHLERRIDDLPEPQGVGYDPVTDTLYVANAGDGSVRLFTGPDLSPAGRIELGSDADNIRVDSTAGRVFVGHGDGALIAIDAATHDKIVSAPLKAHPESFQLDLDTDRVFINVPNAGVIDVVDRTSGIEITSWPTEGRGANFAMALDHARKNILVAFRRPAEVGVFSSTDGKLLTSIPTCGDVDDLFVDSKRDRIYVSCGEGFLDVLSLEGTSYRQTARIATGVGARTSLFVPELDRLLLAVPARGDAQAAIWVFRPSS